VSALAQAHSSPTIIELGIRDVTEPLPADCCVAMTQAMVDMGDRPFFNHQ